MAEDIEQDEYDRFLKDLLEGDWTPEPPPELTPHERFAAIVQILAVPDQVALYAIYLAQSRVKTKTVEVVRAMFEYQQLLKGLGPIRALGRPFPELLTALDTYGFVTVHRRSDRIKIIEHGVPFEDRLAHLAGLDYVAELVRRGSIT